VLIEAKYMPWVFLALSWLFGGVFETCIGLGVGYMSISHTDIREFIPNLRIHQVERFENTKIGQIVRKSHRYVSINGEMPISKQERGFVPFSGKGNTLGSSEDEGEESRLIIST
jgi:hypothetical protein